MDILTLNVLEDYLKGFKGCLLIVSHDRFFSDKVADRVFAFEGDGVVKDFPGNYTVYKNHKEEEEECREREERERKKQEPKPAPAATEKSGKQRKMTFKERQEMEQLERELEALNAEKQEVEAVLSSGTLPAEELMAKSERIGVLMEELDEKEMRW